MNWRETRKRDFPTMNRESICLLSMNFCVFLNRGKKVILIKSFEWNRFCGSCRWAWGPSKDNGCIKCLRSLPSFSHLPTPNLHASAHIIVDPWPLWGLRMLNPYTVKNPCVTLFSQNSTTNSLFLTKKSLIGKIESINTYFYIICYILKIK